MASLVKKTFTIRTYGEDGAHTMASGWCRKMHFMYDRINRYGIVALAAYPEPHELTELYARAPPNVRARIDEIRLLAAAMPA